MAYVKTEWANDSLPAINSGNLNKIEQGIYNADNLANNLIYFKPFQITFDVSTASVGSFVNGHTTNDIPTIPGMSVIGFEIKTVSTNSNQNFVLEPNSRTNKVYAKLYLGYKEGSTTSINVTGHIVYGNSNFVDSTTLT